MAKMVFFPIGNADSTLIHLNDGRLLLYDYCNRPLDENDKRVNLEKEIRAYLKNQNRKDFDLVAFTHADDDHIFDAENIFWLEHAYKYQGENKIKIKTLVVPACFLLETGLDGTARIIREEAKYRLKVGKGVFVIGEPQSLKDWLIKEGIEPESRSNLIIRAGTCLPGFDKSNNGVDIFIHSPFTFKLDNETAPRNSNCLVVQLTFTESGNDMSCMLGGDANYEDWLNIIYITQKNGNKQKLNWDVFHVSHHCSYTALSDEKGDSKTIPYKKIEEMFYNGSNNCYIISPSDPIPSFDTIQPPHKQAATFYREIAKYFGSRDNFIVTMEWPPKSKNPRPIVIETTSNKFKLKQDSSLIGGVTVVVNNPSPRLG